jgi:hypothetical protein
MGWCITLTEKATADGTIAVDMDPLSLLCRLTRTRAVYQGLFGMTTPPLVLTVASARPGRGADVRAWTTATSLAATGDVCAWATSDIREQRPGNRRAQGSSASRGGSPRRGLAGRPAGGGQRGQRGRRSLRQGRIGLAAARAAGRVALNPPW